MGSPMGSPNAPVAPSRIDSKPNSGSSTPNSHSPANSMNNLNNRNHMPNQYGNNNNNGMMARNINNPNMNNQVSIDIHSPRSGNPHNNGKLPDTHNITKAYVNANSSPPGGNGQKTQYSQQQKSNPQPASTTSGSEDTAEVVPNHPFTDKVFSVAYINVPENDDELELVIGDQIKFVEVYDDDWALALRIKDRKEGMVPLTCVKEYFTVLHKN
ncbi:hypothetical protein PIROE2DRAFT_67305 [Piromyces sp. E2]|nr:hypothetical protein PIROE2DRAFT_67305 [Piromyces sp. E2]|eukprot:OUM64501.1 hypothetical protein PIROE2DRAFT_67305 [Piromyces sp. E2]